MGKTSNKDKTFPFRVPFSSVKFREDRIRRCKPKMRVFYLVVKVFLRLWKKRWAFARLENGSSDGLGSQFGAGEEGHLMGSQEVQIIVGEIFPFELDNQKSHFVHSLGKQRSKVERHKLRGNNGVEIAYLRMKLRGYFCPKRCLISHIHVFFNSLMCVVFAWRLCIIMRGKRAFA